MGILPSSTECRLLPHHHRCQMALLRCQPRGLRAETGVRGSCCKALERQAPVMLGVLDAESGELAATPSYSPRDLSFAACEGLFSHL